MPKHILHVFSSLNMGGAESRIMDVTRAINRQEYQFDFLTMKEEPQYFDEEIAALGCHEFRIRQPRETGIFKNFLSMYRIMKKGHYDAVHCHTSFHCGLACFAAWLAGVRIRIAHARTTGSINNAKLTKLFLSIGHILIHLFANVKLAVSMEAGKYLFVGSKFETLKNAINVEKYLSVTEDMVQKERIELAINERASIIGMVGRFEEMKNHKFAIRWFNEYTRKNPNSVFVIVGDGKLKSDIEKMASDLGVRNIIFTGIRKDINVFMNLFNVVFVPSIYEGLSGVVSEAQACGKNVIKSDSFTNENDMGLGLIKEISLDAPLEQWSLAVTDVLMNPTKVSKEMIINAFDKKGYSLQSEIRRLCEIYSR